MMSAKDLGLGDVRLGDRDAAAILASKQRIAELEIVLEMIVKHWRKGEPVECLEDLIDTAERCLWKRTNRT